MNPFEKVIDALGLNHESQSLSGHLYVLLAKLAASYDDSAWTHANPAHEVLARIGDDLLATIPGQQYRRVLTSLADRLGG